MQTQTADDLKTDIDLLYRTYSRDLLRDKVAVVTGASRGIGRAIAIAYGALGAKVVVNYAGNEAAANATVRDIESLGGTAKALRFDVADFAAAHDSLKAVEKELGAIHVLVNNAGIAKDTLIVRMKEEDWDANLDTNLKGAFHCSRAVIPGMMKRREGKIINISSVIGLRGNAGQVAYAASKAGLIGVTRSLARELASRNIQVNAIAPGYITTDMTATIDPKMVEQLKSWIPLERLGSPFDIARAAVFLGSVASDYVTGQTLAVDGGMTMQ